MASISCNRSRISEAELVVANGCVVAVGGGGCIGDVGCTTTTACVTVVVVDEDDKDVRLLILDVVTAADGLVV